LQLTHNYRRGVELSPDGHKLVFSAGTITPNGQDTSKLYVRSLDRWDAVELPGTEDADTPFFSPDGQSIGYQQRGQIKTVSLAGGEAKKVVSKLENPGPGWGPPGISWGRNEKMLGSMQAAFEMTNEYLKTRTQFGVPIGSFQALKHRAAKMYVELELARSAVMHAQRVIDEQRDDAAIARAVSIAKARCSDTFVLIGNEAVQMHGGIGMTDEHDIGFYLKRARATQLTFGDAAWHRDRLASLDGY